MTRRGCATRNRFLLLSAFDVRPAKLSDKLKRRPSYVARLVTALRRLEREAGRNVELMWLLGRLVPDHKTIADFRKENGAALRKVCARFVALCRSMGLLQGCSAAIDGSKFKAVNNRDKNFTHARMARRMAQIEESIARYCISSTAPTAKTRRRPSSPRPRG